MRPYVTFYAFELICVSVYARNESCHLQLLAATTLSETVRLKQQYKIQLLSFLVSSAYSSAQMKLSFESGVNQIRYSLTSNW